MKLYVLLIMVITFTFFGAPGHAAQKSRILPFKAWKHKKIDEAKSIVSELRRESRRIGAIRDADDENRDTLGHRISQAELNLGVARDLSANDYFVLYVAPQFKDNMEAFTEAAKSLSAKDMAEILSAYQKRLQPVDVFGAKASPVGIDPAAM
jgi:hypothetical protein